MEWSIKAGREKRAKFGADARPWTAEELDLIRGAPALDAGGWVLRGAFVQLGTERVNGMGIGSIPWSSVVRWCEINRYGGAARDHVIAVILALDARYLKRVRDASSGK